MSSSFIRVFSKIDIFGMSTHFMINNRSKYQTISGAIFTLIYITSIIVLFLLLGNDLFYHENPTTGFSQIYNSNPKQTNISRNGYFFMFGLQDSNANQFIDPQIYNLTIINGVRNPITQEVKIIPIPIEPCTNEHLPDDPNLQTYFTNLVGGPDMLQNIYCIQKGHDNEFSLKGEYDQQEYNYIKIQIYTCKNGSDVICKDDQTIQNALLQSYYGFYSTDNLFDMNDYKNPAKMYGLDYYTPTSYKVPKQMVRYIKTNRVQSDHGWLLSEVEEEDYFSFDSITESFTLLDSYAPGQKFLTMSIRKQYYESIYTRSYLKIKTLIAEISGFLNLIMWFLMWSSRPFIKKEYYDAITNNVFNFEGGGETKIKNIELLKKTETLKDMIDSKNLEVHLSSQRKSSVENLVNTVMSSRDSPLHFGIWDTIKSFFCRKPELEVKKKQNEKAVKTIFSNLDIFFVLKKFMELEKLKMILLDEDQFRLFEYLPKPVILKNLKLKLNYTSKNDQSVQLKKNSLYLEDDLVQRTRTVKKAFNNICKKPELSNIDLKLIQMLDENMKDLLQSKNEIEKVISSLSDKKTKTEVEVELTQKDELGSLERFTLNQFEERKNLGFNQIRPIIEMDD